MRKIKGSITTPRGFKAVGISAGLKKSGKKDLALIYSEAPCSAAAVFTTNKFMAAPVIVSQKQVRSGRAQAIVINSGSANAATGKQGITDAWEMVDVAAHALKIKKQDVLVCSTGTIGSLLPLEKIVPGINKAAKLISKSGGRDAAHAILTTDLVKKEIVVKAGKYTIAGIAKGSGMIEPNMATMLAFITTDAGIDSKLLQKILKECSDMSFNMISVDRCQSTNDTVIALANGESKSEVRSPKSEVEFKRALEYVCVELAKMIARDGEGATQLLTVRVTGAANDKEARLAAKAIVGSDLLKCAVYGRDFNPGRIFGAVGSVPVKIDLDKVKANMRFGKRETLVTCDLGVGSATAHAWGCDLTEGYIKINAKYHT